MQNNNIFGGFFYAFLSCYSLVYFSVLGNAYSCLFGEICHVEQFGISVFFLGIPALLCFPLYLLNVCVEFKNLKLNLPLILHLIILFVSFKITNFNKTLAYSLIMADGLLLILQFAVVLKTLRDLEESEK